MSGLAPEKHLEHEFAADVGKKQQTRPGQHPGQCASSAPAVAVTAEEQRRKNEPAEHREHDLVGKAQWLAEQLLGEHRPAHQRQRQDRKSTRLNSSHTVISYAVFCLKKK